MPKMRFPEIYLQVIVTASYKCLLLYRYHP